MRNGETVGAAAIDTTAKTYAAWVTDTKAQVTATLVYFDAYNALAAGKTLALGELASDGFTAAYTEIKSGSGGTLTGPCVCTAGNGCNAYDFTVTGESTVSTGDYDNDLESLLSFNSSASALATIGADGVAANALSVCAEKCSAKLHWLLASTNLPYTMIAASGNNNILTTSDAGASSTVMTDA